MASLGSLLVTDIVESTRLWARYEREMAADLVVHDDAVAKVVDLYGGRVFKRTGDGALAVFDDPVAPVTAGSEIQRTVGSIAWRTEGGIRVRAAVHTGTVIERGGDFFGTAVNRAARLVAVCPPGAVVVSGVTAELLAERPLDEFRLAEVGRCSCEVSPNANRSMRWSPIISPRSAGSATTPSRPMVRSAHCPLPTRR